jgi:hypothetical protein
MSIMRRCDTVTQVLDLPLVARPFQDEIGGPAFARDNGTLAKKSESRATDGRRARLVPGVPLQDMGLLVGENRSYQRDVLMLACRISHRVMLKGS